MGLRVFVFRAPRRAVTSLPGHYAWLRRRAVLLRLRRSGFAFPASSLGWVLLALRRSAALHSLQTAFLFSWAVVCMEPVCAPVGSFMPVPGYVLLFTLRFASSLRLPSYSATGSSALSGSAALLLFEFPGLFLRLAALMPPI